MTSHAARLLILRSTRRRIFCGSGATRQYSSAHLGGNIHCPQFQPGSSFRFAQNNRHFSIDGNDSASPSSSIIQVIQTRVASGELKHDKAQMRVAKRLDRLQNALVGYDNSILFQQEDEESIIDQEQNTNKQKEGLEEYDTKGTTNVEEKLDSHGKIEDSSIAKDDDTVSSPIQKPKKKPQPPALQIPRGLYIHGPVGTGKSMLMDSFFDHLQTTTQKERHHFHAFMSMVHKRIHALKQLDLETKGRNFQIDTSTTNNPIHRVGLEIARNLQVLCLDEFQVTDIADAVILSQLFSVLFQKGVVVVATSNRPPQDLYEGGLNRSYFLPFLDLLQKHCIVHDILSKPQKKKKQSNDQNDSTGTTTTTANNAIDYRTAMASCTSFFVSQSKLESLLQELLLPTSSSVSTEITTSTSTSVGTLQNPDSMSLEVGLQRTFVVPKVYQYYHPQQNQQQQPQSHHLMARISFHDLCDADVGALDYRMIGNSFPIVIIEGIPQMNLSSHNRARRFITLIDELYEAKCALICVPVDDDTNNNNNSIMSPRDLFQTKHDDENGNDKTNNNEDDDGNDDPVSLGIDVATQGGTAVGALASVRELAFAFERASSRIVEMCSRSWWDKVLSSSKPTSK